jgi:hypothetical protein
MNNENNEQRRRAEIFQQRKTIVHISKNNGIFYNGWILEVGSDFFILKDKVKGEVMILFSELVKPIEIYEVRE